MLQQQKRKEKVRTDCPTNGTKKRNETKALFHPPYHRTNEKKKNCDGRENERQNCKLKRFIELQTKIDRHIISQMRTQIRIGYIFG